MAVLYFIQAGNGPIKIGITDNLASRIISLQTGHYEKMEVLYSIETDNAKDLEKFYHKHFKYQQIRGEWFRPDEYLLGFIEKLKTEYDFSEQWIEYWQTISEPICKIIGIAKEYKRKGNLHAVTYIGKELGELINDFNRGAY